MPEKFTLVQITDCHLYADKTALHHGANVYMNLCAVLDNIQEKSIADAIVFTGDLTQDHSQKSYLNFVEAFETHDIDIPVYYVAGNHDAPELLQRYLKEKPFCNDRQIDLLKWQILLVDSKSETPSGEVTFHSQHMLDSKINSEKSQLLVMHHHSKDVGYFIDRHGLTNKNEFYKFLSRHGSIKNIACGHVHQALSMELALPTHKINLFTCPATSIQFDPKANSVANNGQPPGYRVFTLQSNEQLTSEVVFV